MRLALACAALLLTLSCAQHVSFREMSSNGKATGVKFDTGYEERVLQYIWRTYRTRLVNAVRGYEGFRVVGNGGEQMLAAHVGLCLYAALWYIHIYPTTDAIGGWEFGKRSGRRFSKTKFYACRHAQRRRDLRRHGSSAPL